MENTLLSCEVVRDLAALVTDGGACAATQQAVQAHLAGCAECRRYYKQYEKSVGEPARPADGSGAGEAPDGGQGYAKLARRLHRRSLFLRGIYAAAAVLIAFFSFLAARRFDRRR